MTGGRRPLRRRNWAGDSLGARATAARTQVWIAAGGRGLLVVGGTGAKSARASPSPTASLHDLARVLAAVHGFLSGPCDYWPVAVVVPTAAPAYHGSAQSAPPSGLACSHAFGPLSVPPYTSRPGRGAVLADRRQQIARANPYSINHDPFRQTRYVRHLPTLGSGRAAERLRLTRYGFASRRDYTGGS